MKGHDPEDVKPNIRRNCGIGGSIFAAILLLFFDVANSGSYLMSSIFCPVWLFISIVKNASQRPGWRVALLRIAIPILTLGVVWANNSFQWRIAEANAARIVKACEDFHAANGRFPKTLDELVPRYTPRVPRAKYCLTWGDFVYVNNQGTPILWWYVVPPYCCKIYNFEQHRWSCLD